MADTALFMVQGLVAIILILFAVLIENRYGLRKRISMLWHLIVNAETHFKLTARYDTDLPYETIAEELKNVFREHYGTITVLDDGNDTRTVEVDDTFVVTLGMPDDEQVSIETSKITATMRDMRPEIGTLLEVLGDLEDRSQHQVQNTDHHFTDDTFTADLFLPYTSTFITTQLPRGVTLTGYQLDLDYPDYDCSITDTGQSRSISTHHRDDLHTILTRLLKPWAIWWKRMG